MCNLDVFQLIKHFIFLNYSLASEAEVRDGHMTPFAEEDEEAEEREQEDVDEEEEEEYVSQ